MCEWVSGHLSPAIHKFKEWLTLKRLPLCAGTSQTSSSALPHFILAKGLGKVKWQEQGYPALTR